MLPENCCGQAAQYTPSARLTLLPVFTHSIQPIIFFIDRHLFITICQIWCSCTFSIAIGTKMNISGWLHQ